MASDEACEALAELMYHHWRSDHGMSRNWPEAHERQVRHWRKRAAEQIKGLAAQGYRLIQEPRDA